MPWIELHQNLLRHPKLIRLASKLGVKKQDALWHILSLWLWALDYAESGNLEKYGPAEIAFAAEWNGNSVEFVKNLQECRWLDGMALHDWMDYAGRLVEQRAANRERMREKRAKNVHRTEGAQPPDVQGLPNQPDLTNQTKPDPKELERHFERIRQSYPGKKKGFSQEWSNFERKNRKRIKEVLPLIEAGVERYKAEIASQGTEKRFIKHFSTWINQECWTEEPAKGVNGAVNPKHNQPTRQQQLGAAARRMAEGLRQLNGEGQAPNHPDVGFRQPSTTGRTGLDGRAGQGMFEAMEGNPGSYVA